MTEKTKAEWYLEYLDKILAGDKVPGITLDDEVGELLITAKKLIEVDFSIRSKVRDHLRSQLISILLSQDKKDKEVPTNYLLKDEDELLDEELSLAAAGSPEIGWKTSCGLYSNCPFRSCISDCMFRKK
jgi:hypothetical protein